MLNGSKSPAAVISPDPGQAQQPPIQRPHVPIAMRPQAGGGARDQNQAEALRASDVEASLKAMLSNTVGKPSQQQPATMQMGNMGKLPALSTWWWPAYNKPRILVKNIIIHMWQISWFSVHNPI